MGKGGRLANSRNVQNRTFHVFPGYADIIFRRCYKRILFPCSQLCLACMMIGMTGAIVGTANLVPRLCKSLYNDIVTAKKQPTAELLAAINEKQDIISRADRALAKSGVVATKWALEENYYPVGPARKPLQPTSPQTQEYLRHELKKVLALERQLETAGGVKSDLQKL